MKKLLLFSALLVSTILITNDVAFAKNISAEKDSPEYEQRLEKLFEKIQKDTLLSSKTKMECLITFEKQLNTADPAKLNFEQKKEINGCIQAMYSKKFEVMKEKVEKLKGFISKLKKSGKNVKKLEKSLEQAESGLRFLKTAL